MSQTRDVKYGNVTWEVEFNYWPEMPGRHTLPNGDPGYPDEPAEFEILGIFVDGSEIDLTEFLDTTVLENIQSKLEEGYEPEDE